MSQTDDHAGWWQASDGLWYPPESHPDAAAAAPEQQVVTAPVEAPFAAAPPAAEPAPTAVAVMPPAAAPAAAPAAPITFATAAAPAPVGVPAPPATDDPGPMAAAIAAAAQAEAAAAAAAEAAATTRTEAKQAHDKLQFDENGWITIAPPPPPPPPPAPPVWQARLKLGAAIAAAAVVIVVAGIALIPGRPHPKPLDTGIESIGAKDGATNTDPMTTDSTLSSINIQDTDVGDGYNRLVNSSVDPVGGDSCTQPDRPFWPVDGTNWTGYEYQVTNSGIPTGELVASVTVLHTAADATRRYVQDKSLAYVGCLQRWDAQEIFSGSGITPSNETMTPLKVSLPGFDVVAWRFSAQFSAGGQTFPVYTDDILFTKGRIRVWIEMSSLLNPYDQGHRDLLVSRMAQRVNSVITSFSGGR